MGLKSVINVMMATAIAYACILVLMLFVNFIFLQSADPDKFITFFAYTAFYAGAFISGFIYSKTGTSGSITAGIIAGLVYIGILYLISLLFDGERDFITRLIINLIAVAVSGLGGYLGTYKKPKKISPAKNREAVRKRYMTKQV